jgi:hypothetical protein
MTTNHQPPTTNTSNHQQKGTVMTTTLSTPRSTRGDELVAVDHPAGRKAWALAGLLSGIGAFIFFIGPASMLNPSTDSYADNADVLAELDGKAPWVWAFQTSGVALSILLVIFAVGLRRRLSGQEPAGSLVPDLAALGLILMSVMTLVGTGISTEMFHALRHTDEVDPDTIAGHLALYNTMAWVWAGGLLTTGAIVAAARHGSVSRRLGRFAAVMTALVALTQILPFQYLAVLPMAIFLIVVGTSMLRTEAGH